jgi:hypothetical protein
MCLAVPQHLPWLWQDLHSPSLVDRRLRRFAALLQEHAERLAASGEGEAARRLEDLKAGVENVRQAVVSEPDELAPPGYENAVRPIRDEMRWLTMKCLPVIER